MTHETNKNLKVDRENPARQLGRQSWYALGLVAGLIVLHQCLLQPGLNLLTSDAPVINIAGRQRMLSQKLAKAALARVTAQTPDERELRRLELKTTLDEWRDAHDKLKANRADVFFGGSRSPEIEQGFHKLEPHYVAMVEAAEEIASESQDKMFQEALNSLLKHEPEFLSRMHALVGSYQEAARQHVRQLQRLGLIIMGVILLTQIGLHLFVVRPAVQFVGREIEQTEVQYQGLVESMTDGLVVFDQSGTIEFANRRFGGMLGHGTEGLTGKPASLFIADPDRRRFSAMLFDPHLETEPVDLVMRHVDGRLIETMISPQRLRDHHGVPRGLLLVVTDVTSRKAIEHRSRELLDQLAHADRLRAMGAMAAALAHEINQPLGAIANYAEGCLTRLSGPPIDSQDFVLPLEKILRATHRGAEIIRRARGFVRLRPHRITHESINNLVHEVEELCRPEARRRGISLELQLATEPLMIPVDAIQIQQVLTNLIQNAFAAMDQVEPYRRRISLTTGMASTGAVEVTVADTGPGIPADGAEAWFEPFITTREEGTGMGLAIARSIVEAHGGRIWAEANGEGGAVFRFTLPLDSPMVDLSGESLPLMEAVSHV
ncbi:MAG: domain S-box protein [Schlesneria sp.]|nr:domain S-box protein [Schlesneria sp.]